MSTILTNHLPLPETGLVRLPTILHHFQISRSGWYQGVQDGVYPRPIKIGQKSFWDAAEIHNLLANLTSNSARSLCK